MQGTAVPQEQHDLKSQLHIVKENSQEQQTGQAGQSEQEEQILEIQAKFSRMLFESGRMQVALYRAINGEKNWFKVTGCGLIVDRPCVLKGQWENNKKYGKSFTVFASEDLPAPEEEENFTDYLVDMKIKGLGRKTAEGIYKMYGADTIDVMGHPEQLAKVRGISLKKAVLLSAEWADRKTVREFYELFHQIGLPGSQAAYACRMLEKDGLGIQDFKRNPYILCHYEKFAFPEIDAAAMNLEDGSYFNGSVERMTAGIMYCMRRVESQGDVYANCKYLLDRAMKTLFPNKPKAKAALWYRIRELTRGGPLVYEEKIGAVYRKRTYLIETGSAELTAGLLRAPRKARDPEKLKKIIEEADSTLSEKQKEGVMNAFLNNISIITGGPGMGKTYSLRAILAVHEKLSDKNVLLCAPTGRAARKMEENAGFPASTIHHALKLVDDGVSEEQFETVDADMVIVDEFSMVGIELYNSLLKCIATGTTLVIIGDKDQVRSVSCGNVLNDLIESGKVPVTVLDKVYRQAEGSSIVANAYRVNCYKGNPLAYFSANEFFRLDKDTEFIQAKGEEACQAEVLKAAGREAAIRGSDKVQVITLLRKRTAVSTKDLNKKLQEMFNPGEHGKAEFTRGDRIFREGDRVMHLQNVTDSNGDRLSNGDLGTIIKVNRFDRCVTAMYENGMTWEYEGSDLDELEHSYAMTVHKAQGSEYDTVIIPFFEGFAGMRVKSLLYTAMTRAKTKLIIVGDMDSVLYAASHSGYKRNSRLKERLEEKDLTFLK